MMQSNKPKLYLAAPLFSQAELHFNESLADSISDLFDIFLPQRDGGLMAEMISRGVPVAQASRHVFKKDICAIRSSDVVLAVLDGRCIDEGVSVELGFAYALEIKCFGLQTTPIRLLPCGNNPMISNVLKDIFESPEAVRAWAESFCSSQNKKEMQGFGVNGN
jgi:nucleoside 2-deoxyribosyltransferase